MCFAQLYLTLLVNSTKISKQSYKTYLKNIKDNSNYVVCLYLEVQKSLNNDKLNKLLEFYKQYKALSEYIDKQYKLTLNDLALLKLAYEHIAKDQMLMQKFLKIAISELELSRTKLLVSIRRLIEKEKTK